MTTALDLLAREWPLVGRGDTLERFVALRTAVAAASTSSATSVRRTAKGLALVGGAGVGKTRLAAACCDDAAAAGWRTRRIAGSSAASSIPFAAAAPLLSGVGHADTDLATIIRRTHASLVDPGPLCLVVDDAHLLDDASATLVHHLAATSDVLLVLTARSDRLTTGVLSSLWREGTISRVELAGFERVEHDALLSAALGGPVDHIGAERLFTTSAGNPLFTRELLMSAAEDNALLADGHGGWRLSRFPRASIRLAELVSTRIGALDPEERRCLETIAVAEPIPLDVIEAMGLGPVVTRLERRHLVHATETGGLVDLAISHPLYAEVARGHVRPLRARNLRRSLAVALAASPARRQGDAVRIATWRMDAGLVDAVENLLEAAGEALASGDLAAALRFGRAAHDIRPSPATRLGLAHASFRSGDGATVEHLLATSTDDATSSPQQRVEAAVLRAENMFWSLGRNGDASAILAECLRDCEANAPHLRDEVVATVAELRLASMPDDHRGDDRSDARHDEPHRLTALTALGRGDLTTALDIIERAPSGELAGLESFLLVESGWLERGTAAATRSLLHTGRPPSVDDGWAALAIASALLADGAGAAAIESLREATSTFTRRGSFLPRSLCVARTVSALLLMGEPDAALLVLEPASREPLNRIFATDLVRARASIDASTDRHESAVAVLRAHIGASTAPGDDAAVAGCLHDLVRLGAADRGERDRLVAMAAGSTLPVTVLRSRHAACGGDAHQLALLAADAERDGFTVWACELASAALDAMSAGSRVASRDRARAAEQRRVLRLRSGFPLALLITPSATAPAEPVRLRPGELQVATLAADGLSDREIAERLHLSVRTVGNYLLRAYRRLGIAGRDELAAALSDAQLLST